MVASKAFVALVLAVVALAAPSRRQITEPPPEDRVTCTYVLTPDPPVVDDSTLDGDHEFDWTITRQISVESPSGTGWVFVSRLPNIYSVPQPLLTSSSRLSDYQSVPVPWIHNTDGSYEVNATTASNGLSADELKAIVTAWPGSTLQGRFVAEWEVGSVTCQDSAADTGDVEGVKFSL
ncbi:hypothetical protein PM082_007425 [Marasmius tenuissimus]|nr:hypothetical protein PM082_007425 [Marasmius tenuissimus]